MAGRPSVEKWAQDVTRQGRPCSVCALGKDAVADIDAVLSLNDSGQSRVSKPKMAEWLAKHHGYVMGVSPIEGHATRCLGRTNWGTP